MATPVPAKPVPDNARDRIRQETRRVKHKAKQAKAGLTPVKLYLVAYNLVSAALWLNILVLVISATVQPPSGASRAKSSFSTYFKRGSVIPGHVKEAIDRLSNNYDHGNLGWWTKWTQTLAALEVVHAALGFVRSPVGTTASQVFSRLWAVWGVVELAPSAKVSPLFTTMVFAWSATEVVRYLFYAAGVLGINLPALTWLRYTTFIPLYPIGASSEAFLSFSTLPPLSTLPFLPESIKTLSPFSSILSALPRSVGKAIMRTEWGRSFLWHVAKAGAKTKTRAAGSATWGAIEYARLGLFFIWWPALYVLYTYMLGQRHKIIGHGPGRTLKSKTA